MDKIQFKPYTRLKAEQLNQLQDNVEKAIELAERSATSATLDLHGFGRLSTGEGCRLRIAQGFTAILTNGRFYGTDGRPHDIAVAGDGIPITVPGAGTYWVYVNNNGEVTVRAASGNDPIALCEADEWYAGVIEADSTGIIRVDDSGADTVEVTTGYLYWLASLEQRVNELQQGGGGGEGRTQWGDWRPRTADDTRTIEEYVTDAAGAVKEELHGEIEETAERLERRITFLEDTVSGYDENWDEDAVNQLLLRILYAHQVSPDVLMLMYRGFIIIPGICGDGSNNTPDFIDREVTTVPIDPVNHTFG